MNVFSEFREVVIKALKSLVENQDLSADLDFSRVACEPPKDPAHGDIATNAAMVLAKPAGLNPRVLAEKLVAQLLNNPYIESCEVAGPGFVNMTLRPVFWQSELKSIIEIGKAYGDSRLGDQRKVNLEYVSVNPTGPMHVGHCRGAIIGDVLAKLLTKTGYKVTKEYYVNDAGAQVIALAHSLYKRYQQALGVESGELGAYGGEYLIPVGQSLANRDGDKWLKVEESVWMPHLRNFAVEAMMDLIREDLALLKIHHEVFTSEAAIIAEGGVEKSFSELEEKGLIYVGQLPEPKGKTIEDWEPRDLTLFRSTTYGDDQDRALKKSDGSWTYITGDIAYHRNKVSRGYDLLINVWGSDHVGYVKRLKAATHALTDGRIPLEVVLYALVNFMDEGESLKMSKRAGTFIPVREVVDRVGCDATRFMMVTRKTDIPLDFDFAKVIEKSKDNPVYYVQYAYARACSIRRHLLATFPSIDLSPQGLAQVDFGNLKAQEEIDMIKTLAQWPRQIEVAAESREPHRISYYLYHVASVFHGLWTKGRDDAELRFIYPQDEKKSLAKFALVQGMANVIASGLDVFGVQPMEEM
ncbi:MAG: arginine--tRNA ligase [Alphaproteobacteria bacterium]|nr:arginine--tRNA ligase [Alphaproteobacteria bacterium]